MALACSYFRLYFLNTLRNPPALFFTLLFPPLIFALMAPQWGHQPQDKILPFAVFMNYGVQTVALMLLGMGVTQEKNGYWARYVRTLPAPLSAMIWGRFLHALTLASGNMLSVTLMGLFVFGIPITFIQLASLWGVALAGALPMALMGITIGYAANTESSRSIFTLLNLLLLFFALQTTQSGFVLFLQHLLISYQWRVLALSAIHQARPGESWLAALVCLGCYTGVFALLFRRIYYRQN